MEATFVIVGGGIAGVSCIETLSFLKPDSTLILVSESPVIKTAVNFAAVTRTLSSFDVVEQHIDTLSNKYPNIKIVHDSLLEINSENQMILTINNKKIKYKYLCLCMGARPKIIPQGETSPYVLGIRDTDSVDEFIQKLKKSKRIAIVGNGGIASELIYKLENVDVEWIIKDKHTSATFVDPGAAEFLKTPKQEKHENNEFCTRLRYKEENRIGSGAALGPDWYTSFILSGSKTTNKTINIHTETEIANLIHNKETDEFCVTVQMTNGERVEVDLVVSATGVLPRGNTIKTDRELKLSDDYGINVNEKMLTNLPNIYAAGDISNPTWEYALHWFPMKLWTQARQMGCYAAKCMAAQEDNEEVLLDFVFEMFAHATNLFGYKVVLLGLYNGQKLNNDYECLIRMTKGVEFIKFVLKDNRLQGAILIGDTDLAETCENLILNQLDLSPYGDDILNPDIDIEDYFD